MAKLKYKSLDVFLAIQSCILQKIYTIRSSDEIFLFRNYFIFLSLSAGPIPFSGKLSVRGVNFTGSAEFVFQVIDKNGQVHWSNGADENTTISVPVRNGRYLVLLGGQGMSELPSQLFLKIQALSSGTGRPEGR